MKNTIRLDPDDRFTGKLRVPHFHWVWQNTLALLLAVALLGGGTFGILRYFTEYAEAMPAITPSVTLAPTGTATPKPSPTATPHPDATATPEPTATPNPVRSMPLLPGGEVVQDYAPYDNGDLHLRLQKQHAYNSDIYIADVYFEDITHVHTVLAKDTFGRGYVEKPSAMAAESGVFFAVSGDYYGFHDDGIVVRNGTVYRNEPSSRDMCCIFTDGSMRVMPEKEADMPALLSDGLYQSFTFGPALVRDNAVCEEFHTDVIPNNPRCGIGMAENGHLIFVVVDGRRADSEGVDISTFAQLMHELGCTQAYNLDGGATALMIYQGEVISNPSGNFERKMSDIIGLR